MVLLDGNVVDKRQMSIDAGRALLTVAAANLVSATCYAKAVVVEICLIFRNRRPSFSDPLPRRYSRRKAETQLILALQSYRVLILGYLRYDDRGPARSASLCDWRCGSRGRLPVVREPATARAV
jgi:hypothetical protein